MLSVLGENIFEKQSMEMYAEMGVVYTQTPSIPVSLHKHLWT